MSYYNNTESCNTPYNPNTSNYDEWEKEYNEVKTIDGALPTVSFYQEHLYGDNFKQQVQQSDTNYIDYLDNTNKQQVKAKELLKKVKQKEELLKIQLGKVMEERIKLEKFLEKFD